MNYKFTELRYNLEKDTVTVIACFQISKFEWQQKHYTFDAPEEINVFELLDKAKLIIDK